MLEMDPGTTWPRRDIHQPGPEEVYVVSGVFNDGARDYPAGTFLHAPAGSWHIPATTTGCTRFPTTSSSPSCAGRRLSRLRFSRRLS